MKKVYAVFLIAGMYFNQNAKAQSDYNDVATIFYTHCSSCHRDGGIAPFPMINYSQTSSFKSSIRTSLQSNTMPPWNADTAYTTGGHAANRFLHERALTITDKQAILKWIDDGALEGDKTLTPTPPPFNQSKYILNGEADLTLKTPTYHSKANPSNTNPYECFVIPSNLTKDRWLRAFEIVPGNLEAVHHVVVSVDTTNTSQTDTSGSCFSQGGQFGVGGWDPGAPPVILPSQAPFKTGIRIPKGSNFILQLHFAPGSGGKVDSTKLRLFFYPEDETGIREMRAATLLQNWGILPGFGAVPFPANTIKTVKATSATSPLVAHPLQPTTDFTVFSVNPHSHSLCTKIKNYAYSGTDTIPLINIPNWNFNWQGYYFFKKPIKIPAGFTLEAEHIFDNTINNPKLTSPPVSTAWGFKTENEMLFDAFLYLDYQAGDENIDLTAMIESDPLLKVGIKETLKPKIQSYIFPNPATDNLSIYVSSKSTCVGRMFNITGQTVLETGAFNEKITLDVLNIPPGIYIFEITDVVSKDRTTKKVVINK
jgi:Secretion system C-terminal sorting domain/Copper type II ascorbate-dependent monooxygenase, C-terminal domain